jgi:hypothetical protein
VPLSYDCLDVDLDLNLNLNNTLDIDNERLLAASRRFLEEVSTWRLVPRAPRVSLSHATPPGQTTGR